MLLRASIPPVQPRHGAARAHDWRHFEANDLQITVRCHAYMICLGMRKARSHLFHQSSRGSGSPDCFDVIPRKRQRSCPWYQYLAASEKWGSDYSSSALLCPIGKSRSRHLVLRGFSDASYINGGMCVCVCVCFKIPR